MAKRKRPSGARDYPREVRLNELLREIISEELSEIDDRRLGWVSVSGVDVDTELTFARVYLSTLDDEPGPELFDALRDHTKTIRKGISRSSLRRTPKLEWSLDPALESASRIDEILRGMPDSDAEE